MGAVGILFLQIFFFFFFSIPLVGGSQMPVGKCPRVKAAPSPEVFQGYL